MFCCDARTCSVLQAEDGIRDYKVTGVQPCALPIYRRWLMDQFFIEKALCGAKGFGHMFSTTSDSFRCVSPRAAICTFGWLLAKSAFMAAFLPQGLQSPSGRLKLRATNASRSFS